MKPLLTKADVCRILSISPSTLGRERRKGALRAIRVAGQVRYEEEEIERYVREGREKGAENPLQNG